jgi:hypothetical protein
VSAVLVAGTTGPGRAAADRGAAPRAEQAFGVNGVPVSKVSVDGRLVSMDAYLHQVVPASERAGHPMHLVVDGAAAARGYAVAFGSVEAANGYLAARQLGQIPSAVSGSGHAAVTLEHPQTVTLAGEKVGLVTCSIPNHSAKVYKDAACLGSVLGITWNDYVSDLSVYGFDNNITSIGIGDCISNMTVWKGKNKSGSTTSFGGFNVYTGMPLGWNDEIESMATDKNAAGPC